MSKNDKQLAKLGFERLRKLGYKQCELAELFHVDKGTVSQWYRLKRVGTWTVGRVRDIPKLRAAGITIETLRPDLTPERVAKARRRCANWRHKYMQKA
jgi:DNA-binding transcriptional regulator YdaS (Cro superfamily)